MNFDLIDIISLITVFQLTIFSIFLGTQYKSRKSSNNILAAFLISNALFIVDFFLKRHRDDFYLSVPYLYNIGNTFGLLFGPLLFIYTKSLFQKNYKIVKKDFLHFIPFILYLIYYILIFHIHSNDVKSILLSEGYMSRAARIITSLFLNIQTLVYMVISLTLIFKHNSELKKFYSSIEKINLSWLKLVVFAFIIMWMADLVSFVFFDLLNVRTPAFHITLTYISLLINMIFAAIIIFKGLVQSHYFIHFDALHPVEKKITQKTETSKNISCVDVDNLKTHMENEQSFLNPSLTLNELAKELSFQPRYLSQLINDSLGQNFYDFVNKYRIEYAKQLLRKNEFNVLEVIYESGFNSKSVFNTVFKKNTGLTPTQYRRKYNVALKESA